MPRVLGAALLTLGLALAAINGAGVTRAEAQDTNADTEALGGTGYASLTGPIDRLRSRYLERIVERARTLGLDTLVVHVDTDGGEVGHAREMFKTVVDQGRGGPKMVAFIDFRAISAGALIAYAHDEIYMSRAASIGDIGVIFVSAEGEIKYAPEKIETVVRSQLVQAAELRGWDRALLLKMTARTQKLYRVTLDDGTVRHIIEDDLPAFLAAHPDIDPENRSQVYVYRGEDRLLTLTGTEAAELGMATGLAENVDEVYAALGVDAESVLDLTPQLAERTAWALAPIAPALAGLAILFIMFELKTPGVGLFAVLGAIFAGAFVLAQYYLDMAENIELVLIAAGMVLLALDAVLGVGAGLLAVAGGGLTLVGLGLAFMPNELDFDISDPRVIAALGQAMASTLVTVVVAVTGLVLAARLAPSTRFGQRLALKAEVSATTASAGTRATPRRVGAFGVAHETLHPNGLVDINGEVLGARALNGAFINAGAAVEVMGVEFGELLVRAVPDEPPGGEVES